MAVSEKSGAGTRLVLLVIMLTVLACWGWTFRSHGHNWGGDFSLYVAHARNIAFGRPYAAVNYIPEKIVEKDIPPHGPPTYPPVFPLVLAPVYRFAGLDYGLMRAVVQFLWLVSGVLFYLYGCRRGVAPVASAAATGVFLLSSMVLSVKDSVLSESTYLAVSASALLFFDKMYRHEQVRRPVLYGAIAGLLVLTAYLTRVTGIALVAAFAFHELYRTRRLRTFAVAAGAVFLMGFIVYRLTLYDGAGYSSQFRITPGTWARNAVDYFKSPASLWAAIPALLRYPAALATLGLAAAGFIRRLRTGPSVAEFYAVLYMVPLLLYSSGANVRYILPIYPLLLLYCAEALTSLSGLMRPGIRRPAFAALGVLLVAGAAANVAAAARAPEPDGPETVSFHEAAAWIRNNIAPGEVVISWNPRVVALYTERLSAYYRPVSDPALFGDYLEELNAKWVLAFPRSESDSRWLSPYVRSHPDRFETAWRNMDFVVYRLRKEGTR